MNGALTAQAWADNIILAMHAQHYAAEPRGAVFQTCLMELPSGGREFLVCPWSSEYEREAVLRYLRKLMRRRKVRRYAFWSEAWITAGKNADLTVMPSRSPHRIEAVFVVVVDPADPASPVLSYGRIVRGESGGVIRLDRVDGDFGGGAGAVARLLERTL